MLRTYPSAPAEIFVAARVSARAEKAVQPLAAAGRRPVPVAVTVPPAPASDAGGMEPASPTPSPFVGGGIPASTLAKGIGCDELQAMPPTNRMSKARIGLLRLRDGTTSTRAPAWSVEPDPRTRSLDGVQAARPFSSRGETVPPEDYCAGNWLAWSAAARARTAF